VQSQTKNSLNSSSSREDVIYLSQMSHEEWQARLRLVAATLKEWCSSSPAYAHYTDEDWLNLAESCPNVIQPYILP